MSQINLRDIRIYPVKSLAGIQLQEVATEPMGLRGDRRWLLIDDSGVFWCQRRAPRMTLIQASPTPDGFSVSVAGKNQLRVTIPHPDAPRLEVKVQKDILSAALAPDTVNQWFSQALDKPCRLVYMDGDSKRNVLPKFWDKIGPVSFADAVPMMVVSRASLDQLNERLEEPVEMTRFRPNLVVDGVDAFAEDRWQRIRIGDVELEITGRINRCMITTVDPATGRKHAKGEPLRTLTSFRKDGAGVYFGVGAVAMTQGTLSKGAPVEVLQTRD